MKYWSCKTYNSEYIDIVHHNSKQYIANVTIFSCVDSAGNYHCLTYDYIKGTNVRSDLRQFYNILCALDNLHTAGYVHGDVRLENMIFAEGNEGYLIDYDFARKEGEHYPYNYNTELEVRHKTASPSQPMLKYHDRYSLSLCILNSLITKDAVWRHY